MAHQGGLGAVVERVAREVLARRGHGTAVPAEGYARRDGRRWRRTVRRLVIAGLLVLIPVTVALAVAVALLVAWLLGNADTVLAWLSDITRIATAFRGITGGEGG